MLYLAVRGGEGRHILAGRNAHKVFLHAAAMLDLQVTWLCPKDQSSYHSCLLTPEAVEAALSACADQPRAVYLTSPDYLGNMPDIAGIARVCHRHQVLLLVDNAHGAYLRFLPRSLFPMDLGADLCCSSAHKTLPAVTGAAYLHVREADVPYARRALALFGSTSPSYLILQSLDLLNPYLELLPSGLEAFLPSVRALRAALTAHGYTLVGQEEIKLTLLASAAGFTGDELSEILRREGIWAEFHDPDYLVLMLTPENSIEELRKLRSVLCSLEVRPALPRSLPPFTLPVQAMTPRQAVFAASEEVPVEQAVGRVLAFADVGCPPAIPIVMCGEVIDTSAAALFRYYGIQKCAVVI